MGDWSSLPKDCLTEISNRLHTIDDYVRFRAVCNSWRSGLAKHPRNLPCQIPWLMLPSDSCNHSFFSLSQARHRHLNLPETHAKQCCGSSHGWLIFIENTREISLLNPLTRAQVQLPPIPKEYISRYAEEGNEEDTKGIAKLYIHKIILSENPTCNDYTAMAICGGSKKLAFCRSGDEKWSLPKGISRAFDDIVYYKGQFCGLDCEGGRVVCNIMDQTNVTEIETKDLDSYTEKYLVELSGDLILIHSWTGELYTNTWDREPCYERTTSFRLWRLESEYKKWEEVKNLGGSALFVGPNNSFSFFVKEDSKSCKANCIYFIDTEWVDTTITDGLEGFSVGVSDMKTGTYTEFFTWESNETLKSLPQSVWVTPSLC